MSAALNKDISRRLFEKVWNEGKVELLPELNTSDVTIKDPNNVITGRGPEAARQYLMSYKKAFPDLTFRIDRQIAEGDTVVNFMTATGTHEGEMLGLPPTHKKASASVIVTMRFRDGKIAESSTMWDALAFMRSVGAAEMPMAAAMAHR